MKRSVLGVGFALAAFALCMFAGATLAAAGEKGDTTHKARKPRVVGTVAVAKQMVKEGDKEVEKVTAVTLTTAKTKARDAEVISVKLDEKGLELAKEDGKKVVATGSILEEEKNGVKAKVLTVEEFHEYKAATRTAKEPKAKREKKPE